MAGNKGQKSSADKTKKRKREVNDADSKAKRHRKEVKANGATSSQEREKASNSPEKETSGTLVAANGDEVVSRLLGDLANKTDSETGWRISKPMGGRMLDIDPILTDDEQ